MLMRTILRKLMVKGQIMRRSQLAVFPPKPGEIVFIGDSITEGGIWQDWFPDLPVRNLGVGAETVEDVVRRLPAALNQPAAISLLIGTNDLTGFGRSRKPADIAAQIADLVNEIRRLAPGAPLLVNSVLPRGRTFAARIRQLNEQLVEIAAANDAVFVDAWSALANTDAEIRPEYSEDRLHLNGEGYRQWVSVLRPSLESALRQSSPVRMPPGEDSLPR